MEDSASTSSTWQTAFNAVNILCGVGLLTTPYAVALSGGLSLLLLLLVGGMACYTGSLLARCMSQDPKAIRSYPDVCAAPVCGGGGGGSMHMGLLRLHCAFLHPAAATATASGMPPPLSD